MNPVNHIHGKVAVWSASNVDTDQLSPGRFLSRDRAQGYGDALLFDLRFDRAGQERPDFVLNMPNYRNPRILLVAGDNFGCGSSREQAVWALLDHGISCVIARSFSDIFRNNAIENGLLLIGLPAPSIDALQRVVSAVAPCELTVQLDTQTVATPTGVAYPFDFDPNVKHNLLKGLSKIDLTLQFEPAIRSFQAGYRQSYPWLD